MYNFVVLSLLLAAVNAAKYAGPTNQAGLNLIKEFEGFRANFYKDPVGIRTIGYGHACHVWNCAVPLNGKYRVPLTRATGESLLKDDLRASYEKCVNSKVAYSKLNANQYSALVSFTFNLGCGALSSSTLLAKLNRGDVGGAAEEFKKWVHAGGKVLPGLVRRRNAEKALFCSGGVCSGGGGGGSTSCKGVTTAALRVRSSPSTSAKIVTTLNSGTAIVISGRVTGTKVYGNPYWFKNSSGYVSAYYIRMTASNGVSWCKK